MIEEEIEKDPPIIGIDIGTSNTCATVYMDGEIIKIPNEFGEKFTPSVISFFDYNEKLIGTFGKERIMKNQCIIYNSKRIIGRRFNDKEIKEDKNYMQFKIIEDKARDKIKIKIEGLNNLDKDEYYPEEISAMIIKKIKNDAELYLKQKINKAVITTPAYFNQLQRMATKQAARIAGLSVQKIINEPTAAALAYAYKDKKLLGNRNLIFDFGGGTLDLTLLSFSEEEKEKEKKIYCKVLCSYGDTHLGGQDIDNKIYDLVISNYKNEISNFFHKYGNENISCDKYRLLKACEKAKILLSTNQDAFIKIDLFLPTVNINYKLEKSKLNEIVEEIYNDKIKKCFEKFLEKANVKKEDIQNIILVGGSSKIPELQKLIQDYFNKSKLLSSIDPEEVVSMGAGIIGGQIYGEEKLQQLKLFNITSLSLGTNVKNNEMSVIIPRNEDIPITKKRKYITTVDNQETISNMVYEGESLKLEDNYLLGDFKITNLTKRPAGKTEIELEYKLSSNSELTVTATELNRPDATKNERTDVVKLEEPKSILKKDEITNIKKFINSIDKKDLQHLYDLNFLKEVINLKEKLNDGNNNKYNIQYQILSVIDEFLTKFSENKKMDYKVYSLYLVFFFYELNNLFDYRDININDNNNEIFEKFKIKKKIETIIIEINDIIWEILDLFYIENNNEDNSKDNKKLKKKEFYEELKLIIIENLLTDVQYKIYSVIDFSIDYSQKLVEYHKIIEEMNFKLIGYKHLLLNEKNIMNAEIKRLFDEIIKFQKCLEVKKYIIDYNLDTAHRTLYEFEKIKEKCEEYVNNYHFYYFNIDSPEILILKNISDEYNSNFSQENIQKYIEKYKKIIKGKYHAKQNYVGVLDKNDDEDDEDTEEIAYKNLNQNEKEILEIIDRAKNSITERIKNLKNYPKGKFLVMIVKEFSKEYDYYTALNYYNGGKIEKLVNFVKGIFQNDKNVKTIKDFEEKIKDGYILNEINTFLAGNNVDE